MTNRPYVDFKNKWLGKRIDYDKAYGYQCVDLIKQYLDEVLGFGRVGALGNAKNVPSTLTKKGFSKLWVTSIIQWDIIVRTRWTYGHIAIVDRIVNGRVYVLEQNGSWRNSWSWVGENAIRVKDYSISWFDVVLRNDGIVRNYENEVRVVEEKIKEYEERIRVTSEYGESLRR